MTTSKRPAPTVEAEQATQASDSLSDAASAITRVKLRDMSLSEENFDLIAKCIYLINIGPGWSEDGTFTFPDGETWAELEGDDNAD